MPSETEVEQFIWQEHWYPVCFLQDFPDDRPYRYTLYDKGLVLFRDSSGVIRCLDDVCAHRCARLSDGQIVDGHIECLYHGWQFDGSGACARIPQWPADKKKPHNADVKSYQLQVSQGLIWVRPGDPTTPDPVAVPAIEAFDGPGVRSIDFMMDLPYDQSYLIENVIDVAHIHIAHSGVKGGGQRQFALPLEFDVLEDNVRGIRATFRSIGIDTNKQRTNLRGAHVRFLAPNTVVYRSDYIEEGLTSGLALYSAPLGQQRCRLFYRAYSNFWPRRDRYIPRWMEHLNQCRLLEQDMQVVVGQHAQIEQDGRTLNRQWAPIKTSDTLVLRYRKWLDRNGDSLPFYRGLTSSKGTTSNRTSPETRDRFDLHTKICTSCSRAHRNLEHIGAYGLWISLALIPVAILTGYSGLALLSLLALAAAFGADVFRRKLE